MATTTVQLDELAIHGGKPVRDADNPIPLVFPRAIAAGARHNIDRVLDSGFELDMIGEFETAFAQTMGTRHAVALSNCTDALHAVVARRARGDRSWTRRRSDRKSDNGLRVR